MQQSRVYLTDPIFIIAKAPIYRAPITNKLKLVVMQDLDEGKNSTCFYGQVYLLYKMQSLNFRTKINFFSLKKFRLIWGRVPSYGDAYRATYMEQFEDRC
jgi:hypothetical protein